MTKNKKLLILGNTSSVHTKNLKSLIGDYFADTMLLDSQNFSLHKPLKLLNSILNARKTLKTFSPDFIILYQIDIAAFFLSLINRKVPALVVGIGSDVLIMPEKSFFNRFIVRYVINKGNYFNAGSDAIKKKMQQLAKRPIEITLANLGADDILPRRKENIIFSNRLHKDLYNIENIIEGFARFLTGRQYKDWKLVIAATGKETEYKKLADKLNIGNNVEFVGWLDKKTNDYYYSVSKIWVSFPKSDSVSISLLEAMSAGCMPVCYDVPALEGFLTDGENAVVVNNFSENFFDRAVNLIDENIINENRKKARNFADKDLNRQRFYAVFDKEFAGK